MSNVIGRRQKKCGGNAGTAGTNGWQMLTEELSWEVDAQDVVGKSSN